MPTYVYECRKCGKVFEAEQRITEDALTDCSCGEKSSLRRLIQPVAVAFKGAGFHINDYAPKAGGTESESQSQSTTTPSETKPAEGAPSKPAEAAPAPTTPSSDSPAG